MKLLGIPIVSNWRSLWKAVSTQMLALVTLLSGLIAVVPQHLTDLRVPFLGYSYGEIGMFCTVIGAVIGLIGRYIDQGLPPAVPQPAEPEWPATNPTEPR